MDFLDAGDVVALADVFVVNNTPDQSRRRRWSMSSPAAGRCSGDGCGDGFAGIEPASSRQPAEIQQGSYFRISN
jgi:hypothetical protein